MSVKITKDMIIGEILQVDRGLIPILMGSGMHCLGCPASQSETLEEACMVHGVDAEVLASEMNEFLANQAK